MTQIDSLSPRKTNQRRPGVLRQLRRKHCLLSYARIEFATQFAERSIDQRLSQGEVSVFCSARNRSSRPTRGAPHCYLQSHRPPHTAYCRVPPNFQDTTPHCAKSVVGETINKKCTSSPTRNACSRCAAVDTRLLSASYRAPAVPSGECRVRGIRREAHSSLILAAPAWRTATNVLSPANTTNRTTRKTTSRVM